MGFWLITSIVNGKLSITPRNIFLRSRMPTVASKLSVDRSRTFDFNNIIDSDIGLQKLLLRVPLNDGSSIVLGCLVEA